MFFLPIVFAVTAVLAASIMKLIQRQILKSGIEEMELLTYYCICAAVLLLPFISLASLLSLNLNTCLLLVVSGSLWALVCFLVFRAYKHITVSEAEVISTLKVVLLCLGGFLFFSEQLNTVKIIGILLILLAPFVVNKITQIHFNPGILYMGMATVVAVLATLLCKYLAGFTDSSLIAISGFFFPALIYYTVDRPDLKKLASLHKHSSYWIFLVPLLAATEYVLILQALKFGEVSTTSVILQSSPVVVFMLESLSGKLESLGYRHATSIGMCFLGSTMICVVG